MFHPVENGPKWISSKSSSSLKTTWETFVIRFLIYHLLIPHRRSKRGQSEITRWVSCALHTCPPTHLPTDPPTYLLTYPSAHLPTYPSAHLPTWPPTLRPTHPPFDPPAHHLPQEAGLIYLNIFNISMQSLRALNAETLDDVNVAL